MGCQNRVALGQAIGLLCCLSTPAFAQIPLPKFGGEAPAVRLVRLDDLSEEAQLLVDRLHRTEVAARERATKLRAELDLQIADLQKALGEEPGTDPHDLSTAKDLKDQLTQEEALLKRAVEVAGRALSLTKAELLPPTSEIGLDELIALERSARRLLQESESSQTTVARLQALADLEPDIVERKPSLAQQLVEIEWYVHKAQAALAHARALAAKVKVRRANQRVEVFGTRLRVTPEDITKTEARLRRVEREMASKLEALAQERKKAKKLHARRAPRRKSSKEALKREDHATLLSRLDLLTKKEEALSAKLYKLRVRSLVERSIAHRTLLHVPPELSLRQTTAKLLKLEQYQAEAERDISRLREREEEKAKERIIAKAIAERRRVLESGLGVLLESHHHYEVAQIILEIGSGSLEQSFSVTWINLFLTALVMGAGVILLAYGLGYVHRLIGADGILTRLLPIKPAYLSRMDAVVSLMWPLGVIAICSSIVIWPVWNADITLREALAAIDHPLFYVDDEAVSVLSVLQFLFTIWAAVVISKLIREFLGRRVYRRLEWDIGLTNALDTFVNYLTIIVGVILGLRFVGIGLSSLAVLAGVLGIGIGFGLRNIAENFISGLIILAERPIKIGDFIDIDGSVEGQVQNIRARSTTVITRDNISIIIPNSDFVSSRVTNWSHGDPKVRVAVEIGVAYGSDTDAVRKILSEVAQRHGQVLKKPAPEVHFRAFGESSLNFQLLFWIEEQVHRFRIASDLHFAIDGAFRRAGIVIAFPQLDLHVRQLPEPYGDVRALPSEGVEVDDKQGLPVDEDG